VLKFTMPSGAEVSFRVPKKDATKLRGKYKVGQDRPSEGFFSRTDLYIDQAHAGTARPKTSEANRAFLGSWCGYWNNAIPGKLVVQEVTDEGLATGTFEWSFRGRSRKFTGEITNQELYFTDDRPDAKVFYRLRNDGTLISRWKRSGGTTYIEYVRCGYTKTANKIETTEQNREFIGDWCDRKDPGPLNRLTVTDVTAEGTATGIYAWPNDILLFKGTIANGKLRFWFNERGAKVRVRLRDDGTLKGEWDEDGSKSTIKLVPCSSVGVTSNVVTYSVLT